MNLRSAGEKQRNTNWRRRAKERVGAWAARRRWLTQSLTFAGGVVAVISPWIWLGLPTGEEEFWTIPISTWVIVLRALSIIVGVLALVAVAVDKLADQWEERAAHDTLLEGERTAEKSMLELNVVINEALCTLTVAGKRRDDAVESLRRTVVQQAANSIGDGARATLYRLERDWRDLRVLKDAVHGVKDRRDKPNKPFFERNNPELNIWTMMDRDDDEPDVRRYPEQIEGLDWSKKQYVEYLSVPVKARGAQLGMLSVNSREQGAIGGPQRAVIIAMAKVLGMATAAAMPPRDLRDKIDRDRQHATQTSAVGGTLTAGEEGER